MPDSVFYPSDHAIGLAPRIEQPLPEQLQRIGSLLREARKEVVFLLADNVESEHAGEGYGDDDSDASSVFEVDSLSEIAEDLTCDVENLMDLDALCDAAKESTSSYEAEPTAEAVEGLASASISAAQVYAEMIQMRFPQANHRLVEYLGRANYYRFVRCSQQREKNERQVDGSPETGRFDATTVDGSRFHDSGIGTSLCTGSYAETVMSFHHGDGNVVRIPPLPEEGKNGIPFSCIACGKKVAIRSNRAWKRHLFSDLEPYNCLESSCRETIGPLGRRENWVEHLAVYHGYGDQWQSFPCSLCLEETGDGEANVTIHLEKHLQDIALAALPNNRDDPSEHESDSWLYEPSMSWHASSNDELPRSLRSDENATADRRGEDPNISKDAGTTQVEHTKHATAQSSGPSNDHGQSALHDDNRHESVPAVELDAIFEASKLSAYWNVSEAEIFPRLLNHYGSDWIAIAGSLKTKNATMVQNYYTRRKESTDWVNIVQKADARLSQEVREAIQQHKALPYHYETPVSTKDVSPPSIAAAMPPFDSVLNRMRSTSDVGSATGPSKPTPIEESPPAGPSPSRKQWVNPNIKRRSELDRAASTKDVGPATGKAPPTGPRALKES
ncbi:hypothetical protein SAMD00023353_0701280 [Rosellinia necatrix]|uniref:Myb-like domain-containing protein n=1 Tax=Rosellinia necatrix TaxID=77044 RepID=A0A1S7ULV3_ROSNE|nr:hypothetical protein SAMD00023353_0701280 [Rosellinia necatrix]